MTASDLARTPSGQIYNTTETFNIGYYEGMEKEIKY